MNNQPGGQDTRTIFTGVQSFDSRVKESVHNFHNGTPCWEWQGALSAGYGKLTVKRKGLRAHRVAYESLAGPIPEGLHIDHLCRNRKCVNPAHLEPVTLQENLRRSPLCQANRTHCPHGHEYTPENTYIATRIKTGTKFRGCRACAVVRTKRKKQLLKEMGVKGWRNCAYPKTEEAHAVVRGER